MNEFDSDDDLLDDFEDDEFYEDGDDVELLPCPACGSAIDEDSVRCPVCGEYITFGTSVWDGKSWWWLLLGVLGVLATITALALG